MTERRRTQENKMPFWYNGYLKGRQKALLREGTGDNRRTPQCQLCRTFPADGG